MIIVEKGPRHITVHSTAKLNLFLEVLGKRGDGYHNIETLFQEIGLFDRIEISRVDREPGFEKFNCQFSCNISNLAPPGKNLVERAASAFLKEMNISAAVSIQLQKNIPFGAGIGGGSANAAATLQALDVLFESKLPFASLQKIACSLGADCPFFLLGGAAVGRGRGEILERVAMPSRAFLLIIPSLHISTESIYSGVAASLQRDSEVRKLRIEELRSESVSRARAAIFNRLETVAFERHPVLAQFAKTIRAAGIPEIHMTGSGSGLFAVFESLATAHTAYASYERQARAGDLLPADFISNTKTFVVESLFPSEGPCK
ncbi:MAG: 4-(cytidine 5'-diphospho)-2-C-methyl-D-erythritol kinase [Planctomycetota bacterium]